MDPKIDKIIFLDIDGVFNSVKWYESENYQTAKRELPYPLWQLDPEPIRLFVKLLEETKAKVVVSSVWRAARDMRFFRDLFRQRGVPFPRGSLVGKTPVIMNGPRGSEIQAWIDRNNFKGKYIILDDDDDMLEGQQLIQVDERVGFCEKDYQKALEFLR